MTALLKKLHYRSWHRGTRENDLLLGRFADAFMGQMSAEELTLFAALLNQPDYLIYDWIKNGSSPLELQELLTKIRAFADDS